MRFVLRLLSLTLFLLTANYSIAQSCLSTGVNGTVINLPCNDNTADMLFQIPHLKSSSTYSVVSIPYNPFPYVTPGGNEVTSVYIDDKFSDSLQLPFSFCFYDSVFSKFVIGSNGVVTFDLTNTNCNNAWTLNNPIPFLGSQTCSNATGPKYPKYSIMGIYQDINPDLSSSPPDRKIEWRIEGVAPCRKLIVSFYKIALYGDASKLNTSQIVVHESTGLIDVYIQEKTLDQAGTIWNGNLAILGIQKDNFMATGVPGKNASVWSLNDSAYQFIPSGATSRFIKSELYTTGGTLIATTGAGDTSTTVPGLLDINFPDQTTTASSTQYVIKTYYSSCSGGPQLVSTDTVTINKTLSLNATTSNITPSACGPNGAFTVNLPPGIGLLPYSMILDGGSPVLVNGQSQTFSNLTGGLHSLVITTSDGCSQTLQVTIPTSGTLSLSSNSTPVSCNGASNGSITVTSQNGTSPFQYSLNNGPWQSTNTFSNLASGTYTIIVRDNSGCQNSVQVTVANGPQLTTTAIGNPPSCNGATNGSITVTPPVGGVAPFQYNLNGGAIVQTTNVFSNLPPGTYFITVTDAQGCVTSQNPSITVTVPNSSGTLNATATSTPASCSGVNNGTITITPTSGSGPYQYSINSSPFQNGTTITNLAPGTYSITIRDNAGCVSAPISVIVAQGNALLATVTSTATSCTGVNNGTITVTPTNGSGPYTYQLNGGPSQNSNIFNGVSAGNHNIIVTDGAGCVSAPIAVTVAVGPAITGTTTTVPTTCNGASDGMVTVSPTTGNAPYQYAIDGGAFQNSNTFTGLTSGSHTVIIKDAAGCTSSSISVNVPAGAPLTGSATSTPTSCSGANDGTIVATFNGSATEIINLQPKFSLDGGPFQSSGTFINVAAGNHTIVINSINGCVSAPIPVTVATGFALTANVSATPTSCSGAINGTITVTPTNGTGPFQYSIDGVNFQSSNTFTGLATGTYTITFRNNSGCQSTVTATVSPGQPLTANVASNNVLCNGGNTGSITVSVSSNGAPPYQYSLDGVNWQISNTFNGLTAGSYTVRFRDNNNCNGLQNFTITEPTVLNIFPALESVLCNGQNNGKIIVAATGGTPPYQYSLNGTTYQSSNTFNVAAGTHTVYVRDVNGCVRSQVVSVSEPSVLTATTSTIGATCAGVGSITVNANGGSGSYRYSVDGINFQPSNILNVPPGNYTVTIKDINGCITTRPAIVGLINDLTVTPVSDEIICEGTSVQLKPNTNANQFSWTNGSSLNSLNIEQPIASPTVTTQYIVTATLGVCSANDTIDVNVLPAPVADAGTGGEICFGQTFQLRGNGGVSYQWSPATYLSSSSVNNPVSTPTQTIRYSLMVTDANGCQSLQPDIVQVNVTPPIVITISKDTAVAMGDVFQLQASSVANNYVWSPGFGLNNIYVPNPIVTVTGDITYKVTATTNAGCKGEASVTLKVYKGPDIYVPTAFTPNGDGKNDVFKPFPVGIKNYTYFRVYNRWGQVIFSTSEFNKGWEGKVNGIEQPSGTYIWIVEGFTKDNKKISKKGTVTLIR